MKRRPSCPYCGRPYKGAVAIEGRVCPTCHKFKQYEAYTSKRGMCLNCKAARKNRSEKNRKAYFHQYYLDKTKPARQAKGSTTTSRARIDAALDTFKQLTAPKPIMDYSYKDERVD